MVQPSTTVPVSVCGPRGKLLVVPTSGGVLYGSCKVMYTVGNKLWKLYYRFYKLFYKSSLCMGDGLRWPMSEVTHCGTVSVWHQIHLIWNQWVVLTWSDSAMLGSWCGPSRLVAWGFKHHVGNRLISYPVSAIHFKPILSTQMFR